MAQVAEAAFQFQANLTQAADPMSHTPVTLILTVTGALRHRAVLANPPPKPPSRLWTCG